MSVDGNEARKWVSAVEFVREKARTTDNWVELHNAFFGVGGKLMELFPQKQARLRFAASPEFKEITEMIRAKQGSNSPDGTTPSVTDAVERASGTFVVRLPKSIHAANVIEAEQEGVSLNQLCLAKLALPLRTIV